MIKDSCQLFYLTKNIDDNEFKNFIGFMRFIIYVGDEDILKRVVE